MHSSKHRVSAALTRRQGGLTLLRLMLLLGTIGVVLAVAARLLLKY